MSSTFNSAPTSPSHSHFSSELDDTALDRSEGRNVHIYDSADPDTELGGLILSTGVTNANFFFMIEIIFLFEDFFELRNGDGIVMERDDDPLRPGNYYVSGTFSVNNEAILVRSWFLSTTGTRKRSFRQAVRARDGRCVITGEKRLGPNNWQGLQAAHIFPLAYRSYWIDHHYDRWVTTTAPHGDAINSVQNGLLLRSDIHQLFDNYIVSVNPDDNYKIVCFADDVKSIGGKYLDPPFLEHPARPVDQLLRWHYRQAVLSNMKGAGEPIFEHDFYDCDMVGAIRKGPKAAQRMEFELFSRLS